jgi:hypothetical protein
VPYLACVRSVWLTSARPANLYHQLLILFARLPFWGVISPLLELLRPKLRFEAHGRGRLCSLAVVAAGT